MTSSFVEKKIRQILKAHMILKCSGTFDAPETGIILGYPEAPENLQKRHKKGLATLNLVWQEKYEWIKYRRNITVSKENR